MRLRRREDSNFKYDDRYKRRIKRDEADESFTINRCNQSFMINSCKHYLKEKQKDRQAHSGDTDDGYSAYLCQIGYCSKSSSSVWRENTGGDDSFEDDIDPDYSMFLKNLRQNNNSGSDDECGSQISTIFRNTVEAEKTGGVKNSSNITDKEKSESAKDLRYVDNSDKDEQKVFGKISHDSNVCLNITNQGDKSFLNCSEKESNGAVFVMKDGRKLIYEEEAEESSSDTEIFVMDDAPDCGEGNFTPFVCSKVYYAPIEAEGDDCTIDKVRSQFREEVMGIYQKPYDQDEFDELIEEVKLRKPIAGCKNLRGRSKSFSADKGSKSFLDHYGDLKVELDRVFFDRPKMLNILRGFFYWLQNLSHEGAFKPWLDPLCQAVKPRVL